MLDILKRRKAAAFLLIAFLAVTLVGTGCSQGTKEAEKEKPTLIFADAGWDSIRFHNEIAGFIIEKGYGYKTDVTAASTPITFLGLRNGEIDLYMEVWTDNIDDYGEAIEKGDIQELSVNFDDDMQGLYVPTYIIKGDPERGIEPLAPDLKSVQDLPKYWEVFKDPEDKTKGRIYGAIPGWAVDQIMVDKIKNYGLDKNYNVFRPGSDTALATSMVQAVEAGEPWVGYYWEPTWIIGKYDMTLLEEPPYNKEQWEKDYTTAFAPCRVTVAVNKDTINEAPDVVEFLKKYKTNSSVTSEGLAYMQDNNVGADEAAKWFLKNKKDMWLKWVPEDIAKKVEAALQ